jgi:hypothetical protein
MNRQERDRDVGDVLVFALIVFVIIWALINIMAGGPS